MTTNTDLARAHGANIYHLEYSGGVCNINFTRAQLDAYTQAIQQATQDRAETMAEAMRQGAAHFYSTCKTGLNGEDGALMRALELVYKYGRGSSEVEPRESGSVVGPIPTSGHQIQQAAGAAPRPSAPTGQINPDSVAQGKEADHG